MKKYYTLISEVKLKDDCYLTNDYTIKLESGNMQKAIDLIFSKTIYDGLEYLNYCSQLGFEPVIKRKEIAIIPLSEFEDKNIDDKINYLGGINEVIGKYKKFTLGLMSNEKDLEQVIFKHPSRLNDSEIKSLLLNDNLNSKYLNINKNKLKNMIFYI